MPVYFPIIILKPFLWTVEIPTSAAGVGKDLEDSQPWVLIQCLKGTYWMILSYYWIAVSLFKMEAILSVSNTSRSRWRLGS